jgi:FHS family L-fucose permease-like MFS transporter
MAIASFIVLPHLLSDKRDEAGKIIFGSLSEAEKANIRLHDLAIIRDPYVAIGLVVLCIFIIIALTKMPKVSSEENTSEGTHSVKETLTNLWNNTVYREGVFTQVCYVAAQIMVWTFIIQYADHLGINKATAQVYNIIAMSLNLIGRFVGTYIMKFVNTRLLLTIFGIGASVCTLGAICIEGMFGLYSLILISLFMSIMFPSIYGIALENVDSQDTKLGAAFLVMAIVGGALMPPLQGMIIDQVVIMGYPAVNISFVLPLICFLIIIVYGYRSFKRRMLG